MFLDSGHELAYYTRLCWSLTGVVFEVLGRTCLQLGDLAKDLGTWR